MDYKPECFDVEAGTEDGLFGQVIAAKSITEIPDGEIKEELKIEIQQCVRNAKRHAPKSFKNYITSLYTVII